MDELELTFVFDEPVSARNAPVSHITLQGNATRIDGEYHTLGRGRLGRYLRQGHAPDGEPRKSRR